MEFYQFCPQIAPNLHIFFATTKKSSIHVESTHFQSVSAKCRKYKIKKTEGHGKSRNGQGKVLDKYLVKSVGTLVQLRPPLNKKLFPVHRPGGSKRADLNIFFHLLKKEEDFLTFSPVHSSLTKLELGKKKKSRPPDWQFLFPPGSQETIFYLRVA